MVRCIKTERSMVGPGTLEHSYFQIPPIIAGSFGGDGKNEKMKKKIPSLGMVSLKIVAVGK